MFVATLFAALLLSAVHLLPRYLDRMPGRRHRRLVSVAGGFSVGFVFVELLPELAEHSEGVSRLVGWVVPSFDHDVFLVALLGLVLFYGLERAARTASHRMRIEELTIAVLSLYYATIGHLLWDEARMSGGALALFTGAMALHFLVVDYGLRQQHRQAYAEFGRWVLGAAVLAGWLLGWLAELPREVIGLMLAVVAGGIVLIALKEELPADREGRFLPFAAGAAAAAVLFVVV